MNAYSIIKGLHSGFRYVVFIMLVLAIVQALLGWLGKKPYSNINSRVNLFTLISAHIQFLFGIILLFISPLVQFNSSAMKDPVSRYFTAEHWVMMIIAIALITIGYRKSKKLVMPESKHQTVFIFFTIALFIIIGAILAGHLPILG